LNYNFKLSKSGTLHLYILILQKDTSFFPVPCMSQHIATWLVVE